MPDPEISIIIVSWNVHDLLRDCLRSIAQHVRTPHEIVVVDNHSSDRTLEMLQHEFPDVIVIANGHNVGFSRANNQGWQKSRGQYVCFLNPDTEMISDPFAALINYLRHHPQAGVIGPKLLNADRSHQLSVRSFPTFTDQAFILLKLRWLGKVVPSLRKYQFSPESRAIEPVTVDQVMGACMVMPRTVLADGGSFDEGYWIWFEEVDLCRRLKNKGLEVVYYPQAEIIHLGGQSFAQHVSVMKQLWLMKSLGRYANKFWSAQARAGIFALMPVSYVLTFVQSLFKPK